MTEYITPPDLQPDGVPPSETQDDMSPETASPILTEEQVFQGRLFYYTPNAWITLLLVIGNIGIFLIMGLKLATLDPSPSSLIAWGGNIALRTMNGEWWRLLTSLFLHAGIMHVAFNMYVLWNIGNFTERLFGRMGFLVCYLLAGTAGSIVSLACNPTNMVSVGASGAVFGLYGALFGVLVRSKRDASIPRTVLRQLLRNGLLFVGVNIGYGLIYGLFSSKIDMFAHLGGLAGGFLCGLVLAHPLTDAGVASRLYRALLLACVGSALAIGGFFILPQRQDLASFRYHFFTQVEPQLVGKFNNAARQQQAGEIDQQQFADIIANEVLPPWQKEQRAFHALQSQASEHDQEKVALIGDYLDKRAAWWSALATALRSDDKSQFQQASDARTAADEALQKLNDAYRTTK